MPASEQRAARSEGLTGGGSVEHVSLTGHKEKQYSVLREAIKKQLPYLGGRAVSTGLKLRKTYDLAVG